MAARLLVHKHKEQSIHYISIYIPSMCETCRGIKDRISIKVGEFWENNAWEIGNSLSASNLDMQALEISVQNAHDGVLSFKDNFFVIGESDNCKLP